MVCLNVCIGTSCHQRGAEKVVKKFQELIASRKLEDEVDLKGKFCMGRCSETGVQIGINDSLYEICPEDAEKVFINKVLLEISGK